MYEKVGCEVRTFLGCFVVLLLSVESPLLLVCLLLGVRNFGWSREERKKPTLKTVFVLVLVLWGSGSYGSVGL